jgi:BirA family transcriptional regulator, biotin operon repressor / biotin---[acetyl-CoA-carboxylase] ligase
VTRFDVARFAARRAELGLVLGSPLVWLDDTGSTNDDALAAAKAGAVHGAVFGSEAQSRGRGRRGSGWVSAPAAGLWFSLLLRPALRPEATPAITLCAGLAVREAAARRTAAQLQVKWPNDVLACGRKLAGVLVESQASAARVHSVVVGVGINVSQAEFPEPIATLATSLALLGATDTEREGLLADVLAGVAARLEVLDTEGPAAVVRELREHDALLGRPLLVDGRPGVGAGVDEQGRLLLRTENGQVEAQLSGHVELTR